VRRKADAPDYARVRALDSLQRILVVHVVAGIAVVFVVALSIASASAFPARRRKTADIRIEIVAQRSNFRHVFRFFLVFASSP
jgi:hypothetical protein